MLAAFGSSAQNASAAPQTVRATATTTEKVTDHGRTWARRADPVATQRVAGQGRAWSRRVDPVATQRVVSRGRAWRSSYDTATGFTFTTTSTAIQGRRYTETESGRSWR